MQMTFNEVLLALLSEPIFDVAGRPIEHGLGRVGWALARYDAEPSAQHEALITRLREGISRESAADTYFALRSGVSLRHPKFDWLRPREWLTDDRAPMGRRIRELVRGQGLEFDGQRVTPRGPSPWLAHQLELDRLAKDQAERHAGLRRHQRSAA